MMINIFKIKQKKKQKTDDLLNHIIKYKDDMQSAVKKNVIKTQ